MAKTIYERLFDIKPCIMAGYPFTSRIGGARLHPEVTEAMREAAECNVDMHSLLERASQKAAEMVGAEAAFISSGACAGLTLSAAAVMTGTDFSLMEQLPDTEYPVKLRNELILQRGHAIQYTGCLRASGAKIVDVGCTYWPRGRAAGTSWEEYSESWFTATKEGNLIYPLIYVEAKRKYVRVFKVLPMHIENVINERTAAVVYIRSPLCVRGEYEVPLQELINVARKYTLPVICDFASEAYKKAHLKMALERGADLVVFSGGKDIMGPNNTGVIFGRRELIEAVRHNSSPHTRFIVGRGFKVSKEQIVGFVVALEKFLQIDEEAQFKRDLDLCHYISKQFEDFPHVETSVYIPDDEVEGLFYFPEVHLKLNEEALGITAYEVASLLWAGEPQIFMNSYLSPWGIVEIITNGLQNGEADTLVTCIKRLFSRNLK